MTPASPTLDPAFVTAFRAGTLTAAQVEVALPQDRAAVIFLLLQLCTTLANRTDTPASTAHQPSGSIPPYAKPTASPRRKKRGAQKGHTGVARPRPSVIDHHRTHQLPDCPHCGGQLTRTKRTRTRSSKTSPTTSNPKPPNTRFTATGVPAAKSRSNRESPTPYPTAHSAITPSHFRRGCTTVWESPPAKSLMSSANISG